MNTEPCEASIGQEEVSGKPVLIKCGRPATLRMEFLLPFGVYLCDNCYKLMKERR
jgi:hypothetical protein